MSPEKTLDRFKSRQDYSPSADVDQRTYVRGLSPVWIKNPFEQLMLGVLSKFDTDKERTAWADKEWPAIWARHLLPREVSKQARMVLAWRLTRLLGQHSGLVDPTSPLGNLPWQVWTQPGPERSAAVLRTLPLGNYWPDKDTQHCWETQIPEDYSHWLRPPPEQAPAAYKNTWRAFVTFMVDRHRMHLGVEADPALGRMGVRMLLDPVYEDRHWPTPDELQDFEEDVVFEVLGLLSGERPREDQTRDRRTISRLGVIREVQREFNLTLHEGRALVNLARTMATDLTRSTPDQDKAIMTLQLERLSEDARGEMDLRNEATALKSLAMIQGLTRNEDIGGMEDVIDAMQSVTIEQRDEDEAMFLEHLQETD